MVEPQAGSGQRGSPRTLTASSRAHITARRSRVPGSKRGAEHRSGEWRRVVLPRRPSARGLKKISKKKKFFFKSLLRQLPTSAAGREPSRADRRPPLPLCASCLRRLWSSCGPGQSRAAPPPVTSGGGACSWAAAAPAVGRAAGFPAVSQRQPPGPGPPHRGAEGLCNPSPVCQGWRRAPIICWSVKQ